MGSSQSQHDITSTGEPWIMEVFARSQDGCQVVRYDFTTEETNINPSFGAGVDAWFNRIWLFSLGGETSFFF